MSNTTSRAGSEFPADRPFRALREPVSNNLLRVHFGPRLCIPDVDGMSLLEAAVAYAESGSFVLPTSKSDVKNPGSIVGGKWHKQSSRDPDVIRGWWKQHRNIGGIALHAGRSGAVVFDLDVSELARVPQRFREALRQGRLQHSRQTGDRGHYLYAVADGETFGNGAGAFAPYGEVRGKNGVIVVAPTPHPEPGGEYRWAERGEVPPLPDVLRACLREAGNEAAPLVPEELDAFYAEHTGNDRPEALEGVLTVFAQDAMNSRHEALRNSLCMAFREARVDCYPAKEAANQLKASFLAAFDGVPGRRPDPDEFARTAKWAAAQALQADPDEILARLDRADLSDDDTFADHVRREVAKLRVRDQARVQYADEKARALLGQHADRFIDGAAFLTEGVECDPLWGHGSQVLWAKGEGLMICGPQGVGKSTVVQQLVLARMGLRDADLFGFPVLADDRPILYLAMDRPPQIRRSFARMVDVGDEAVLATLKRQLVVWPGPPPFDAATAPRAFADWVAEHGREPGLVIVDSLKDLASGLSQDEVGAGVNQAMQLVLADGTEFINLHHQRKANADNKKPDKLADVYGSGWLTAGMGSVLLIWGEAGASTVEVSHLKQPQDKVGPLIVDHSHGQGRSAAQDPLERLTEVARTAGQQGITEAEAVRALFDVGRDDDSYDNHKKQARRRLDRLTGDGVLVHSPGTRGGSGGGGVPARWVYILFSNGGSD